MVFCVAVRIRVLTRSFDPSNDTRPFLRQRYLVLDQNNQTVTSDVNELYLPTQIFMIISRRKTQSMIEILQLF